MTIQIELQPEAEARYAAEAHERGLPLQRYLEDKLNGGEPLLLPSRSQLTEEEFRASLDRLARYSSEIPSFSMQSFSRQAFYADHD